MEGDGFKDGRPPEVSQLAEEKPLEEPQPQNPNPPQVAYY